MLDLMLYTGGDYEKAERALDVRRSVTLRKFYLEQAYYKVQDYLK